METLAYLWVNITGILGQAADLLFALLGLGLLLAGLLVYFLAPYVFRFLIYRKLYELWFGNKKRKRTT